MEALVADGGQAAQPVREEEAALRQARRVFYLHLGPPCTTFSLARKPALRSKARPHGFRPREALTRMGNSLFLRCLALVQRQTAKSL